MKREMLAPAVPAMWAVPAVPAVPDAGRTGTRMEWEQGTPRGADARRALLSDVPIFGDLPAEQLTWLARASSFDTFAPGDYIVRQGEPGGSVYVIVAGRVQVLAHIERDGIVTEAAITSLGEGETLGELSLLDGEPRSASCVALSRTTCLRLDRDAFLAALRNHWELSRALLAVLAQRLRRADARLAEHARDPLTGLYSRRALAELYEREVIRAERVARRQGQTVQPLALIFADVDRFKAINDCFGHQTGDLVLCAVAHTLTAATRRTDFVARLGGDEFVVLMPDAGAEGAACVAARVRESLLSTPPGPVPFSVSLGSALVDASAPASFEALLAVADAAMYRDKSR